MGSLTAQQTIFGWVLSGPLASKKSHSVSIQVHHAYEPSLNDSLCRFWEIEEPPKAKYYSTDDDEREILFNATHSRGQVSRYCVRLPFRQPINQMKETISIALASFLILEKNWKGIRN